MDSLHIQRQAHTLTRMYKITNNHIEIDPHTYQHNTNNQRTRNAQNQTYHTNTHAYKHSYFPCTILDWNRLPQRILDSKTILIHKTNSHTCHHNTLTLTIILESFSSLHTRCSPPPNSQLHIWVICTAAGALRIITLNQIQKRRLQNKWRLLKTVAHQLKLRSEIHAGKLMELEYWLPD